MGSIRAGVGCDESDRPVFGLLPRRSRRRLEQRRGALSLRVPVLLRAGRPHLLRRLPPRPQCSPIVEVSKTGPDGPPGERSAWRWAAQAERWAASRQGGATVGAGSPTPVRQGGLWERGQPARRRLRQRPVPAPSVPGFLLPPLPSSALPLVLVFLLVLPPRLPAPACLPKLGSLRALCVKKSGVTLLGILGLYEGRKGRRHGGALARAFSRTGVWARGRRPAPARPCAFSAQTPPGSTGCRPRAR